MGLNSLLMYSIYKTKQTNTNTFRFMIAMCASDFLQAMIVMPAVAVTISIRGDHKSCLLDQLTHYGFYLFAYFSYFMLMCISFDRLYQIKKLRRSSRPLSNRQLCFLIGVCFVFTAISSYIGVSFISFPFQMALVGVNICLILSVFIAYSLLLRKVRIHNISVTKSLANTNFNGMVSARLDSQTTSLIWAMLVFLIITYVPFNIITPMLIYHKYEKNQIQSPAVSVATMWAFVFIFAYCSVNALVFFKGNGRIRRFVRRQVIGFLHEGESSISNRVGITRSDVA